MKFGLTILISLFWMLLPAKGTGTMTIEEVGSRLREVQEKTKDFSADLYQEKKLSLLKEKIISRGKIRYKRPDKVYIEISHPESSQMVFDGKNVLLYFPKEKLAERYSIHSNPFVERYLLFSKDPFQEKLAEWSIVEELGSFLVIDVFPKMKDPIFVKTKLWVSKKEWMVLGMEMVEKNGDITLLRYSNIKVNMGLLDADFRIDLPKEVKITEIK